MKCIKTLVAIVGFLALMPLSPALAETKLDRLIAKENTLLAGIEKLESSIEKSINNENLLVPLIQCLFFPRFYREMTKKREKIPVF